jgi:hypothetical protein
MCALSDLAIETLWQLFRNGPTWDGDLASKTGRDELVKLGLVDRGRGYQWLVWAGIDEALARGYDRRKERDHGVSTAASRRVIPIWDTVSAH